MTPAPGELWTTRALEDLRAARYRPAAWARFLGASFVRWLEVRRARPELARQATRWSAAGMLAAAAGRELSAARGGQTPRRSPALAWWTATALMLDWHLGMVENARGEARPLRAADALTMVRTALVPFVAAAAPSSRRFLTFLAAGAATDLADGPLARRAGPTRLGRDLDPAADIAFLAAAARAARRAGWLPGLAAALIAGRSIAPVATLTIGYFKDARRPATETFGDARWTSPLLYSGLAASALGRRSVAAALAGAGSLGAIVSFASGAPGRATGQPPRCSADRSSAAPRIRRYRPAPLRAWRGTSQQSLMNRRSRSGV